MKFTLSWLRDHLDTDASLDKITDKLTAIGLEVEEIHDPSKGLEAFQVGHVVSATQHPNADRLQCCIVDNGTSQETVICGAPNVKTGLKIVFAPVGTFIPGTGITLKNATIRDYPSHGMICSAFELGLSDDHDQIIELPEDAPIGARYVDYRGLTDPVIEIAITPNRGDCLGVRGIARDLAATGLGVLKPLQLNNISGTYPSPIDWQIADDANACNHVRGRFFRGVTNAPSPNWLKDRLTAIGLRPISALVDITNYISFDLGRPLHIFDVDKLAGKQLTMRCAKPQETLLALDDNSYHLDDDMTVIADTSGPQAIAGIIGGRASGCSLSTVNAFLEVADFLPTPIAQAGRKLGIDSDARYRFERTVDPASTDWGMTVASAMIQEICGGEPSEICIAGSLKQPQKQVALHTEKLKSFAGTDISDHTAETILRNLGFKTSLTNGVLNASVPSWRPDIEGPHCLIEEILRINGFDKITPISLPRNSETGTENIPFSVLQGAQARRALSIRGLSEVITFSFMEKNRATLFSPNAADLTLANPISSDLDVMRPTLIPNLLAVAMRNLDRGFANIGVFEIGSEFSTEFVDTQRRVMAAVRIGQTALRHWHQKPRPIDAFDIKADIEAVFTALHVPIGNIQIGDDFPSYYHPGHAASMALGKNILAVFGQLHPKYQQEIGLKSPAFAGEIFLDNLPYPRANANKTRAPLVISNLPAVQRDFAFLVPTATAAATVIRAVKSAEKKLLSNVEIFDLYAGAELQDQKSIALSVTLQPTKTTFTEAEIDALCQKIITAVTSKTGGQLRG